MSVLFAKLCYSPETGVSGKGDPETYLRFLGLFLFKKLSSIIALTSYNSQGVIFTRALVSLREMIL